METIDATYWRVRLFGKTELDAGSERIGDRGARALAQALAENSTLTSLRLRNQGLGPEGARALAEALRKNSTLAILGLQDNGIGDSGASALAGALLKNSALTKLHLEGNGIGKAGIRKLLGALDTNSSLRELTLDKKDDIPNLPRFIESALQNPDRLRRQEQQKTLPNIGKANLENRTRHETAEDPSTADEHTTVEGESTPKWTAELCPPPRMELLMVPGINPLPLPSSVATANSRWTAGFPSRALSLPEKRSTALLGSPAVNRTIYEIDPLHLRQGNYLGSGAFGIVVDGMYQKHTKVSLKLIKGSDLIGRQLEEAVKELECEMEVWLRLPYHTNVLPLLGWCREPLCLVTLYMTGGTARKYLVAVGMTHLHSLPTPILHLDIKGDNILVDEGGVAKIADFGLSKIRETASLHTTLKGGGTPMFMAPEGGSVSAAGRDLIRIMTTRTDLSFCQAQAEPGTATDVYAFGMTMWELLSRGQKPLWSALQAYGAEAFGERVRTDPKFRPPRPYACPDATWDLITRCWAMDAAARPRFEEIADELKAILDGM